MGFTAPIDGYGIYELVHADTGQSVWGPRLMQIAAAGFKLVMNYDILNGHIADVTAYINYAAGLGLKVIVGLQATSIWRDASYSTAYPSLYADSGNAGTGIAFMQYVVGQVKSLSGVWGYYVGDEVAAADHTTFATYAAAIKTADSTHPRLFIASGSSSSSVASGTNLFYDSCDVWGDDYYPVGDNALYANTTAQQAAKVQAQCDTRAIQSAMVLQAHSLAQYGVAGAPWPTEAQMQQARYDALTNMTPRVILWFNYYDVTNTGSPAFAPALQWTYLTNAIAGRSGIALFPALTRRGAPQGSYATAVMADSPRAYYRLGERTGLIAYDQTGNHYNGLLSATGITLGQPGMISFDTDTAMLFASPGFIALPSGLNTSGWTALTIELLFSVANLNGFHNFIANDDPASTNNGIDLYFSGSSGKVSFSIGNGASHASIFAAIAQAINTSYYVALVYDGANINLYLAPLTASTLTAAQTAVPFTGSIGAAAQAMVIGKDAASSADYYAGILDEVAIYRNTALTLPQLQKHFTAITQGARSTTVLFPSAVRRSS